MNSGPQGPDSIAKTSAIGSDVIILDATTGRELLRVTNDASSWSPVWSPAGDGIGFLHIDGGWRDHRIRAATRGMDVGAKDEVMQLIAYGQSETDADAQGEHGLYLFADVSAATTDCPPTAERECPTPA